MWHTRPQAARVLTEDGAIKLYLQLRIIRWQPWRHLWDSHNKNFPFTPTEKQAMHSNELLTLVLAALDDGKGNDIKVIDVRDKTNITDYMVIASGTSDRHVVSLADRVVERIKENRLMPIGVEGQNTGEWVLVDLGDAIIHVMKPQAREFYQLEKLWQGEYSYPTTPAVASH